MNAQNARILRFPSAPGSQPPQPTVAEVIAAFITHQELMVRLGRKTARAAENVCHYLKSFADAYGDALPSDGGEHQFEQWLLDNPQWIARDTITSALGSVVTAFHWAERTRLIQHSHYRRNHNLAPPPTWRPSITPEEARAILLAAKRRGFRSSRIAFRFAIYFLLETGARTCELRDVRWEMVDWDRGVLTLTKHKTAAATGDARLIPLDGLIMRLLRLAWNRRGHPRDGPIFLNGRGDPLQCGSFARYFRTVATSAGIRKEVSAYSIRHGFIVQALENGVGARQIADVVGHADTRQIDRRYGRGARQRINYLKATARAARKKRRE